MPPVPLDNSTQNSALAPACTIAPAVTPWSGLSVGSIVSCTTGTWTNSPTSYTYSWCGNGSGILYEFLPVPLPGTPGGSSYMLGPTDVAVAPNNLMACVVTASNEYGSSSAQSNEFYCPAGALPPLNCSAVGIQAANYQNLARSYNFTSGSMPPDWWSPTGAEGYNATYFQPSQVSVGSTGCALTAQTGGPLTYLSGYIHTLGSYSFQFGRVRFCAQMPSISGSWPVGLWPGLWLYHTPSSTNVEIDILEMPLNATTMYSTLHNWALNLQWQSTDTIAGAMTGYHIYEMVWEPGMVTFGYDGVAFAQYTEAAIGSTDWIFDSPEMYLLATLGVQGGEWAGMPTPNSTTLAAMPLSMLVQSVSVYQ